MTCAGLRKQRLNSLQVGREAPGGYGDDVAQPRPAAGYRVSGVTPACSAAYAPSRLARTKTDTDNTGLIARGAPREQPTP
ncbi:MAG: hypothetical protein MI924_21715 [Chloroflexales bacterium]|nr:hypothetical protein [Chloroflexales bacterium]